MKVLSDVILFMKGLEKEMISMWVLAEIEGATLKALTLISADY